MTEQVLFFYTAETHYAGSLKIVIFHVLLLQFTQFRAVINIVHLINEVVYNLEMLC
jgi:hypothetical protein